MDGAANYRRLPLLLDGTPDAEATDPKAKFVYGTGMPSAEGLRNALIKMHAEPGGKRNVTWTSLREEPVLVGYM